MKKLIKLTFLSTLMLLAVFSCKDDGCVENTEILSAQNISIGYSDPAVDGCGWTIMIGEEIYAPVNLSEEYQVDHATANITYEKLSTSKPCALAAEIPQIYLHSIELVD